MWVELVYSFFFFLSQIWRQTQWHTKSVKVLWKEIRKVNGIGKKWNWNFYKEAEVTDNMVLEGSKQMVWYYKICVSLLMQESGMYKKYYF